MIRFTHKGAFAAAFAAMLLLSFSTARAATLPIGTWKLHPAYNNAERIVPAFGQLFVLSDGSLYSYSPLENENAVFTYDKTGGLSDVDIASMACCNECKALVLAYSNGNIDLLYENGTMHNCPDIVIGNPGNVTVGNINIYGDTAFIPIGNRLVQFNVGRCEISACYNFTSQVKSAVVLMDSIYCFTADSVMGAKMDKGINLLDPAAWKTIGKGRFEGAVTYDNSIFAVSQEHAFYRIADANSLELKLLIGNGVVSLPSTGPEGMVISTDSTAFRYVSADSIVSYRLPFHTNSAVLWNRELWGAHDVDGVARYRIDDPESGNEGSAVCTAAYIKPNSPRRNWIHSVSWPSAGKMLAVGGCQNYNGIVWPGTVMTYEDDEWKYFDENVSEFTGLRYINLTEAAVDPDNQSRVFVGSARQGLYEFEDGHFAHHYTWDNSGLETIIPSYPYDYVSVSSLMFDKHGNLWMTNNEIDTIIKILTPEGDWKKLYYPELSGLPTYKQMKQDHNGVIWINSSRYLPGIAAIDYGGTIDNQNDDRIRFAGPYWTNQDGKSEEITDIFSYDFDLNGEMWICTNRGIFILKNPDSFIYDENPVFERVKINRNDGSGLADYLLDGAYVTALYIDQGNRKWVGTLSNGVFLFSEDGTQTIEHFTVENSPLPSNNVISITEDGRDGSLFFCTELGTAQYGGQARDPEKTLQSSNMSVYPNPVMPSYDGYVTVTGLTENSIVRIVNAEGRLLFQGRSNGGSISWNLSDQSGRKVPSGVYQAIVTNSENTYSESISITVIR